MEEQEVEVEIPPADLDAELFTGETKVRPEFDQELLEVGDEGLLELPFGVGGGQVQEVQQVGVLEHHPGIRVHLCHQWRHFWRGEDRAFKQAGAYLPIKLAAGPPSLNGQPQIKLLS